MLPVSVNNLKLYVRFFKSTFGVLIPQHTAHPPGRTWVSSVLECPYEDSAYALALGKALAAFPAACPT